MKEPSICDKCERPFGAPGIVHDPNLCSECKPGPTQRHPVYFITSVEITSKERILERNIRHEKTGGISRWDPDYDFGRINSRTWGFVHDLDEAIDMVERNYMDLHECSFPWVFIEGLRPSFPNCEPTVQLVYEWQDEKWVRLTEWPKELLEIYESNKVVKIITSMG